MQILKPRVPLKEKMFFVEHLYVMLKASISLDRALLTIGTQTRNKAFAKIIASIEQTVRSGATLSEGLLRYESVFGAFFINMVKAGEFSGKLEEALHRLHIQLKKDYDLKSKVKGALSYPTFVVVAMIVIGAAMMAYVMPKIIPLFQSFGAQLPLATRILIAVSNFVSAYIIWIVIFGIVAVVGLMRLLRGPARGPWHAALLHIPVIKRFVQEVNLARFARTFSTLLSTDILVTEALQMTSRVVENEQYRRALSAASNKIKTGVPIASVFKEYSSLFPPTVHTMIAVGEESGTLTTLLDEVAEFYEESVDEMSKSLSSILEPILIVILGAAVGGIAIAILMPMYSLVEQI